LGELTGKGGTSNAALIFVLVMIIPTIGILAAVAIPAYGDYTTRAQLSEGVVLGKLASDAVDNYYLRTGKIPYTLDEAGFNNTTGKYVSNVTIDPENENLVILVTFKLSGPTNIAGKKLIISPYKNSDESIGWKCSSNEIAVRFLPQSCQ